VKTVDEVRQESGESGLSPIADAIAEAAESAGIEISVYCRTIAGDRSRNGDEREEAVWLLGRLDASVAVDDLQALALDETESIGVRAEAVRACGRLTRASLRSLTSLIAHRSQPLVEATLYSLGFYATSEPWALDLVLKFLSNPANTARLRALAVDLLGGAEDSPAVRQAALLALGDEDAEVRLFAINTVEQLGILDLAHNQIEALVADDAFIPGWGRVSDRAREALS